MAWLTILSKGVQIADAGLQITAVALDKERSNWDIVNASMQGLFIIAQVGDLSIRNSNLKNQVSDHTKLGLAISTAALDVSRTASQITARYLKNIPIGKFEIAMIIVQVAGVACFRMGDITHTVKPIVHEKNHKTCDMLIDISDKTFQVMNIGGSVLSMCVSAPKAYERAVTYWNRRQMERARQQARYERIAHAAGFQRRQDAPQGPLSQPNLSSLADPFSEDLDTEENNKEIAAQCTILIGIGGLLNDPHRDPRHDPQILASIKEFPSMVHRDPRLRHFCKITGKPIRFIVGPNIPEEEKTDLEDVTYEREALVNWIREKPEQAPPQWPSERVPLPLSEHSFVEIKMRQRDINRTLTDIINEVWKNPPFV